LTKKEAFLLPSLRFLFVATVKDPTGVFSDIKPPMLSARQTANLEDRLVLDTGMGTIEVDAEFR
jgi:hypothetical protein